MAAAKRKSIYLQGSYETGEGLREVGQKARVIVGKGRTKEEKNIINTRGETNASGIMYGNSNIIFPIEQSPTAKYGPKAAQKPSLPFDKQVFWGDWLHTNKKK